MIALCGAMAALAFILSQFKIFTMPQGGSITLAALPVLVVALAAGPLYGLATGLLLGIMKIAFTGHVFGFIQALLDYPAAYSGLAVAGLASDRGFPAMVIFSFLALALKFLCHFVSGYYFFSKSAWISLAYNASYGTPESAATLLCLYMLYKKKVIKALKKILG